MAGSHERHERRCKRNHTHAAFIVSIAFSRRSHIGAWCEVREREKRGEVERDRGRGGGGPSLSHPTPSPPCFSAHICLHHPHNLNLERLLSQHWGRTFVFQFALSQFMRNAQASVNAILIKGKVSICSFDACSKVVHPRFLVLELSLAFASLL